MPGELNRTDPWTDFMLRMCDQFEALVEAKPTCIAEMLRELLKHDESISCLELMRQHVAGVTDRDLHGLPAQMHAHGYYASIEGPWLVCSKSKKQHDTTLFAAQAAQVLAEANMMLVPRSTGQSKESRLAA
jgi:hypothetical protein